jgi:hypothetical protein
MNHVKPSILVVLFLAIMSIAGQAQDTSGTAKLVLTIKDIDYKSDIALLDASIQMELPKGSGFVYMPFPFSFSNDLRLNIEPNSASNPVLFGFIRPDNKYAIIQIALSGQPVNITIACTGLLVPLGESQQLKAQKVLSILLRESRNNLTRVLGNVRLVAFTETIILSDKVERSEPTSRHSNIEAESIVDLKEYSDRYRDMYFFLKNEENKYALTGVLGVLAILIGLLTAPKLAVTELFRKIFIGIDVIAILVLVYVFLQVLPSEARLKDSNAIVTFGSAFGLLVGCLISLIAFSKRD